MTDQNFEYFLTKFPLTSRGPDVTDEHRAMFSGRVPDTLLSHWQEFGFSGFGNGLVWLVDPLEWQATGAMFLEGLRHPSLGADAQYIPIVRSAFGKIWFWTPGFGWSLNVDPVLGTAFFRTGDDSVSSDDLALGAFFVACRKDRFDFDDEHEVGLFDPVRERLGPLRADEVYGFVPALRYGGAPVAQNVSIFPIHAHLAILREAIGTDWRS